MRELTGGDGVDVVLDSLGGPISLRSFRALRPGGRLVVFGRYATLSHGRKDWRAVIEWYAAIVAVWLWGKLSPRRRALKYQIQKFRDHAQWRDGAVGGEPRYPEWFREDFGALIQLLREGKIHPVVAERLPLTEARHAHELLESSASKGSSCSCRRLTSTLIYGPRYLPIAEHGLMEDFSHVGAARHGTDHHGTAARGSQCQRPPGATPRRRTRGGGSPIAPTATAAVPSSSHLPNTNVLITRFRCPGRRR